MIIEKYEKQEEEEEEEEEEDVNHISNNSVYLLNFLIIDIQFLSGVLLVKVQSFPALLPVVPSRLKNLVFPAIFP